MAVFKSNAKEKKKLQLQSRCLFLIDETKLHEFSASKGECFGKTFNSVDVETVFSKRLVLYNFLFPIFSAIHVPRRYSCLEDIYILFTNVVTKK